MVTLAAMASALSAAGTAYAQDGQPHSLKASANFSDVTLSWKTPADAITLQWHDDEDYNGVDGTLKNPEGAVTLYTAAKFTAEELKAYAGQTVQSISYFEYREVFKASVLIYEDGVPVREQAADLSGFEKNSWRTVALSEPYVIPEGKEVMFSVRYEYGRNLDFVGICDRSAQRGKGNLYSLDGKTWNADGPGDFLITANLQNNATGEPTGYNVYRDGTKVNSEVLEDVTDYTLTGETDGTHTYKVGALYADGEKMSAEVQASPRSILTSVPPVPVVTGSVSNLQGTLSWAAPLKRGSEITWSSKNFKQAIGGTSTSDPKVWIKQELDVNDLAAFPNHKITAINAYVGSEGGIKSVTAFVMKDGKIDYYEVMAEDVTAAISAGEWNKFTLQTPYEMKPGSTYAFGLFYTHVAKAHPVGVDDATIVSAKGNSFSTSSVSSKGFDKTNPSWKTLASGSIPGNFMLSADVEALSEDAAKPQEITAYDVYRNDSRIAENLSSTTYTDDVADLGTYEYAVVAKTAEGTESAETALNVTYTLPEAYAAPTIVDYNQEGKDISMLWTSDAYEMKHYGTAKYIAGFTEDMALLYGTKFTKEELADYAGYKLHSLSFGIGAELDAFKLQVITGDGEVLLTKEYQKGDIEPGYIYRTTLDESESVRIPAGKDLYLAYNTTLPANTNAMLLDGGPAVDGGAMVNLSNGVGTWLKLGTIASDFSGYNIVIGALALPDAPEGAAEKAAKAGAVSLNSTATGVGRVEKITSAVNRNTTAADELPEIEPLYSVQKEAAKAADKPKAMSFRVYRNGDMVAEGSATEYAETLGSYGVFDYYVTTVYENGWESPASRVIEFTNIIAQRAQAPYDLKGETDGTNLSLSWKAAAEAPELTYQTGDNDMVLGMTGSGTREGYHVIRMKAAEMADKVGQEVSHIKFKLADTDLLTASVVVMYGDNVLYEQEVDVTDLAVGWNTVRLNNPVPVSALFDLGVGYHITYANGIKPMVCDEGPAVAGYGDLISSSGTPGYWYSLNDKFGQNYNWRISATLKQPDGSLSASKARRADSETTYTVYRDGEVVESGLTSTEYTVLNAASGSYTVTEVSAGTESAESNAVKFSGTSGISPAVSDAKATDATVYSIDGRAVGKRSGMESLKKGIYIVNGKKLVVE